MRETRRKSRTEIREISEGSDAKIPGRYKAIQRYSWRYKANSHIRQGQRQKESPPSASSGEADLQGRVRRKRIQTGNLHLTLGEKSW